MPRFLPTPRDRQVLEAVRTHGHLTGQHIRRLFFRRPDGGLATIQAVNTRLRKLQAGGFLVAAVVNGGHGSGPYAYTLGPNGRVLFRRLNAAPRLTSAGPAWHALEIAGFRVSLEEALRAREGQIVEWMGEPAIRALVFGRRGWPIPDALCHWRLPEREGTFLLEWDRGSESLAILVEKLRRYDAFWRSHGHQQFLPGLRLRPRLRPRLAIVVSSPNERTGWCAGWLAIGGQPTPSPWALRRMRMRIRWEWCGGGATWARLEVYSSSSIAIICYNVCTGDIR